LPALKPKKSRGQKIFRNLGEEILHYIVKTNIIMAREDYIPSNDELFDQQLQTFKNTIGNYPGALSAAQISAQAGDADYFHYLLSCQALAKNSARQWSSWKTRMRHSSAGGVEIVPVPPVFPTAVPAVAPGIEPRFRATAKVVRDGPTFNDPMGDALGINGPEQTGPDMATIQPNLKVKVQGNAVAADWGWEGQGNFLDMIRLEVDRGDGKGFVFLVMDTTPGYIDNTPFPATPGKWTYRGIFLVGDAEVGQWSNPVSVMVGT
jgi:hypothetical protein